MCSKKMPLGVRLDFRGSKATVAKSAAWGSETVVRAVSESDPSSAFMTVLPTLSILILQASGFIMMMFLFLASPTNMGRLLYEALKVCGTYPSEDHFKGFEFQLS